jgi:hypothetical protein
LVTVAATNMSSAGDVVEVLPSSRRVMRRTRQTISLPTRFAIRTLDCQVAAPGRRSWVWSVSAFRCPHCWLAAATRQVVRRPPIVAVSYRCLAPTSDHRARSN